MIDNVTEEKNEKLPLVALYGRTNVGKSTLFNCLTEKKQALVSNISGTTRDSNLGIVEWNNSAFEIVDTAGIIDYRYIGKKIKSDDLDEMVQAQAISYLEKATLLIFLADAKAGLMPEDIELARAINRSEKYKKKTILVINKVDSLRAEAEAAQFNKLGLGEPFAVSAVSGLGTGDLLDLIVNRLDKKRKNKAPEKYGDNDLAINVCLVGKPNVGKSSLLNSILGYERVVVSPIPHTTRESQDTKINFKDNLIRLIDTAGISRQGKKGKGLEKFGIEKTFSSLERADIALLILDLSEEITHQDLKIIEEINNRRKSLVIIGNKWDKIEDRDTKKWTEFLRNKMPFIAYAPIQFISAKTGEKVGKIMDLVVEIAKQRKLALSASQTEKFLKRVVKIHKPAKGKGTKPPRIYEFVQEKNNPPLFKLRIGPNDDLHFSYVRFMENRLRERHGFLGTPINIRVTKDKKSHTTYNE
ncbi:ribosome biogenesis GTPase Der [Candidatus Falkowbacteria bacterium]|nr:ribosome biogenesis GTPase Der [Candidatus Falkowbacteria bacterium]NCT55037.1 ribosome biogenesis GTPase Der [Candidatus Falkowbacteria bacterium]